MVCASERRDCSLHSPAFFVRPVCTVQPLPGDNRLQSLRAIITSTGPSTRISSGSSIKTLTVENRKREREREWQCLPFFLWPRLSAAVCALGGRWQLILISHNLACSMQQAEPKEDSQVERWLSEHTTTLSIDIRGRSKWMSWTRNHHCDTVPRHNISHSFGSFIETN